MSTIKISALDAALPSGIDNATDVIIINDGSITKQITVHNFMSASGASIKGDLIPSSSATENTSSFNLGSETSAWKELFVATSSINFVDPKSGAITKWTKDDVANLKLGKSLRVGDSKQIVHESDNSTFVQMKSTAPGRVIHKVSNVSLFDMTTGSFQIGDSIVPLTLRSNTFSITGSTSNTGSFDNSGSFSNEGSSSFTGSFDISGSTTVSGSFTVTDLLTVLADYGQTGSFGVSGSSTFQGDVNMDGNVNVQDLLTVLSGFNASGSSTNTGSFNNSGSFTNEGTGSFTGSFENSGSFENTGSFNNSGSFTNEGTGSFTGSFENSGSFTNEGTGSFTGSLESSGSGRFTSGIRIIGSGSEITQNPTTTTSSLFSIYIDPDLDTDIDFNALDTCGNILINCEANILNSGNTIDAATTLNLQSGTRRTATFGIGNRNFGSNNLIAGNGNTLSGSVSPISSIALGGNNLIGASTLFCLAAGSDNTIEGPSGTLGAFVHGRGNLVNNFFYGHAEGYLSTASGDYAHAEGENCIAAGHASHAEGINTQAIGKGSNSAGSSSISVGNFSYAGGIGTVASSSGQTVVGEYNLHNNTEPYFIIGNGLNDGGRRDLATFASQSILLNADITASFELAVSGNIDFRTNNKHLRGILSGSDTTRNIIGINEGNQVEVGNSTGNQIHLIGHVTASQTIRNGLGTASGLYAVSFGGLETDNTASGDRSVAIGPRAQATGNSSFAVLGKARGDSSIALRSTATATAPSSVCLGGKTEATGSVSLSNNAIAVAEDSVALGKFNTITGPSLGSAADPVFLVIGNGSNSNSRSDLILFRSQSIVVDLLSIPTTDPNNAGQLWRSGSSGNEKHLMISLG